MGEIVKWDPSTLADAVRQKVQAAVAELIPAEQWNQMVQLEIDQLEDRGRVENDDESK